MTSFLLLSRRGLGPVRPWFLALLLGWPASAAAQPPAAGPPTAPQPRPDAEPAPASPGGLPDRDGDPTGNATGATGDDNEDTAADRAPPVSEAPATTGEPPPAPAALPARATQEGSAKGADAEGASTEGAGAEGAGAEGPRAASPTPTPAGDEVEPAARAKPDLEYEVGARVMTGWRYRVRHPVSGPANTQQRFFLKQARFKFDARFRKRMRAQLDIEFADALDNSLDPHEVRHLRDAWLEYRTGSEFRLRIGSLKRPFTRIEGIGAGSLPLRGRGLGNGLIVESMNYGERSLGARIGGKIKALGLDWKLMASKPGYRVDGVNINARVEYDVLDWLEVGVNYVHQRREDSSSADEEMIGGHGFGADLRLNPAGLYVVVDAYMADELRFGSQPVETIVSQLGTEFKAAAVSGFATYDFPLSKHYVLQPVAFVEWADRSLEYSGSEAMRYVFGINTLWREEYLRVMPQVELIRPGGDIARSLWHKSETFYLLISGQL